MMQSPIVSGVEPLLAVAAIRAKARAEKARNDYRHSVIVNLTELDRRILELRVKARTATGKLKDRLDGSLKVIAGSRERFATDFDALDGVPTSAWTAAKTTLDREWYALRALVDRAA